MADKEIKFPAPEDSFPEKRGNGSGTAISYSVQARLAYFEPRMVCGQMLDTRWTTVNFEMGRVGVPADKFESLPGHNTAVANGLVSYQAAQALRWWFLANADKEFSCGCIETRLIKHTVRYEYSITADSAHDYIGEGESRTNIMPADYHKKPEPKAA
jgi:hypothetical protein